MEQYNVIICGGSACATFSRTSATTVFNLIIPLICIGITDSSAPILILGVFSLRCRFNFLMTMGLEGSDEYQYIISNKKGRLSYLRL